MKRILKKLREDYREQQRYFREGAEEIADKNLHLLQSLSLLTVGILLFFYVVTPLVLTSWHMTPQHFLLLPAALTVYGVTRVCQRLGYCSSQVVTLLCLLFESVLFLFIILIDVLGSPDTPSTFMPLLCIVLPSLFILPFQLIYPLVLTFEAIFVLAVTLYKSAFIGSYDVFTSIAGIVFSVATANTILRLRVQDHSVRRTYEELSRMDALSGILNKSAFESAARRYLLSRGHSVSCALLMLDLDDFKAVNDRLGHSAGDLLLQTTGKILTETFRTTDIIGRFGGDEFIVLIKNTADPLLLTERCRALRQALRSAKGAPEGITCSIGIVCAAAQSVTYDTLFRQADAALYEAKAGGKDGRVFHSYAAPEACDPEAVC